MLRCGLATIMPGSSCEAATGEGGEVDKRAFVEDWAVGERDGMVSMDSMPDSGRRTSRVLYV